MAETTTTATVKVGLDAETDRALADWSGEDGRSKRGQAAYLIRRLVEARRRDPAGLARLLGPAAPAALAAPPASQPAATID